MPSGVYDESPLEKSLLPKLMSDEIDVEKVNVLV